MKNLSQIKTGLQGRKFSEVFAPNNSLEMRLSEFDKTIIDTVFSQLANIFPAWQHHWTSADQIASVKKEWVKAFFENDIDSIAKVKLGFVKARSCTNPFLPSPGEFVSWCKPNPEDMGYPSIERAKQLCITHRAVSNLFLRPKPTRPLIVELFSRVDWHLMDAVFTQKQHKKAEDHFEKVYLELISSGYKEPEENDFTRLETSEVVNPRMSEEQKFQKSERGQSVLDGIKQKLKQGKS